MKRKRVLAVLLAASMVVCNLPVWAANTETGPDDESKAVIEEEAESPSEKAEDTTQSEPVTDGNPENDEEIAENSDTETDGINKENAEQQKNDIEGKKQNLDENIKESPQVLSEGDSEISIPDPALLQVILAEIDADQNGKVEKSEIETLSSLEITEMDIPDGQITLDLSGIENARNLKELKIIMSDNKRLTIQNPENLGNVEELWNLTMNFCDFSDMEWLTKICTCSTLELKNDNIKELPALDRINPSSIFLDNNNISDINSAISGCYTISELSLSGNKITSFPQIESAISFISLSNNKELRDLSNLSSLINNSDVKIIDLTSNPQLDRNSIIEAALDLKDISLNIRENFRLSKITSSLNAIDMDGGKADLQYKTASEDIIKIEEGVIKPVKVGETTITVTSGDFNKSFQVKIIEDGDVAAFADDCITNAPEVQACDANQDGIITKKELEALTELYLDPGKETINFAGLEDAVNLMGLTVCHGPGAEITRMDNVQELSKLKKLSRLYILNSDLPDLTFLEGMSGLRTLELPSCRISKIQEVEKTTNLEMLSVPNAGLTEIPDFSRMNKLYSLNLSGNEIDNIDNLKNSYITSLDVSDNNIHDMTPVVSLPLESANFSNNNISVIPKWVNYSGLYELNLGGNPLKDFQNLKPLLNISIPIEAYGAGITPEEQFKQLFDNSDRSMYMGNKAVIYVKKWISTEESVEVTYTSENEDALSIKENQYLSANMAGTFKVNAKCGNTVKSFNVIIDEPESPVTIKRKDIPEVNCSDREYCPILETDNVLWSYNEGKIEEVMENVKSYVRNDTEISVKTQLWLDYLVLDKNDTLWRCGKKDIDSPYTAEKVADNIIEYNNLHYMDKTHTLYDTQDGKKRADNVIKYRYGYSSTGSQVRYLFTTDHTVRDIILDKVLVEDVDDCYFDSTMDFFVCVIDKKAVWYQFDGRKIIELDNIKAIDSDEQIVETYDGNTVKYSYNFDGEKGEIHFTSQDDVIPAMPFKSEHYCITDKGDKLYVLDANGVLWSKLQYKDDRFYEKVGDKVTQAFGHGTNFYYLKDNVLYNGVNEKVILKDIKCINSFYSDSLMLYIRTDGTLYESDFNGTVENKILLDVKYVYTDPNTYTFAYIVREDGSVWKYDTMRQSNAVAKQIKAGREVGDIDGDGKIEIKDMLPILHSLSGNLNMEQEELKKADIDGDGKVTIKDVLRVLHFVSGQSSAL